jgi:hypothetical protein
MSVGVTLLARVERKGGRQVKKLVSTLSVMIFLILACSACGTSSSTSKIETLAASKQASPTSTASATEPRWGVQTKTSGCRANGPLPDKECTPGDIIPTATKNQICQPGYASSVRNVPTSAKTRAYRMYGIVSHRPGQYEVDHLVSLELGGSNDISNLWPEAASPKPGFHEKDRVENYLHNQVCSGAISLQQAQIEIATNWLNVYKTMPKNETGSSNTDSQ